jgi:hypothetical protein
MKRYSRISKISDKELQKLCNLVIKTPGMTQYGHRARTAVMLPLNIAQQVAHIAEQRSISVGQAILEILQGSLSEHSDQK